MGPRSPRRSRGAEAPRSPARVLPHIPSSPRNKPRAQCGTAAHGPLLAGSLLPALRGLRPPCPSRPPASLPSPSGVGAARALKGVWTPGLRLRVTGSAREGRRRLFSGRSTGFACGALGNATAVKRRGVTIRPQWHIARQGAATTGRTRPPGRAWASGRRLETPARTCPGDAAGETQKADAGTAPRSRTAPSVRASGRPPSVRASAEATVSFRAPREAAPSPPCARAGGRGDAGLAACASQRPPPAAGTCSQEGRCPQGL